MSRVTNQQRPHLTQEEIAALIDAVHERRKTIFPGAYGPHPHKEAIFDTDVQEAWKEVTVIVNAVHDNSWSVEKINEMYFMVITRI